MFEGRLYVEHPRRERELISAKAFHEIIENEQTQETLRFIRSQVKATSILILRKKVDTQKAEAKSGDKEMELSVVSKDCLKTLAKFTHGNPILVESSRPFIWGHMYQELVDGLKDVAGSGTVRYILRKVGSFSLSLQLAKLIGANIEHLNDRYLEVEIAYV